MTDVIRTPWTSEQVQALNGYQENGTRPPRVCSSEGHASGPVSYTHLTLPTN